MFIYGGWKKNILTFLSVFIKIDIGFIQPLMSFFKVSLRMMFYARCKLIQSCYFMQRNCSLAFDILHCWIGARKLCFIIAYEAKAYDGTMICDVEQNRSEGQKKRVRQKDCVGESLTSESFLSNKHKILTLVLQHTLLNFHTYISNVVGWKILSCIQWNNFLEMLLLLIQKGLIVQSSCFFAYFSFCNKESKEKKKKTYNLYIENIAR